VLPSIFNESRSRRIDGRKLAHLSEQGTRIDPSPVPAETQMKMRASRAPGAAHLSDDLTPTHLLPLFHKDLTEMENHAHQLITMVDEHALAAEEVLLCQHHGPLRHRHHGSTFDSGIIRSTMRAPGLAVHDPLATEATALRQGLEGFGEGKLKSPISWPSQHGADASILFLSPL